MRYTIRSAVMGKAKSPSSPQINLVQQFFIHSNPERHKEIQYCLAMNVLNPNINYIYLLTEYEKEYTPYTAEQLGITSEKIIQIPLPHRLKYSDVFHLVENINCAGYVIIANADIFFDETLQQVLQSNMNEQPLVACQLRYEYDGHMANTKIFGPRADSQDAWIYHSSWNSRLYHNKKVFDFQLGQAGCDNHLSYLFKICGFELINDPEKVHVFHYHKTQIRDYNQKDAIKPPYLFIMPIGCSMEMDVDMNHQELMYNYITTQLIKKERFIIPRVAGIENITAHEILNDKEPRYAVMKNNAGILLSDIVSVRKYGEMYFDAFKNCQVYTGWDKMGGDYVYAGIRPSHEYIDDTLCGGKLKVWAHCLDIFDYIYANKIWTTALRGKKVLIVSSLIKSIKLQIEKGEMYPNELFPECEFVYIKPPQTHGKHISLEWDRELELFNERLAQVGDYDVALVSAGGYGNLICNEIYKQGHSAIYVGGVLQMYFGIYGNRWLNEKPAAVKMFKNERWVRPLPEERPPGYNELEGGCYY
jgi:hypothetical protein